ncbi:MAG: hypothetical protein L6R39_000502 [Caloplaca ligustica]|nr:MAG: hypothetical protein L6R39_000502 [Caloplaca ligustica]
MALPSSEQGLAPRVYWRIWLALVMQSFLQSWFLSPKPDRQQPINSDAIYMHSSDKPQYIIKYLYSQRDSLYQLVPSQSKTQIEIKLVKIESLWGVTAISRERESFGVVSFPILSGGSAMFGFVDAVAGSIISDVI